MSDPAADGAPADAAPLGDEADAIDDTTVRAVQRIPLLTVRAGPRDGATWRDRLKEEYKALIQYIKMNKENDNDWFMLAADDAGVRCGSIPLRPLIVFAACAPLSRWTGKCWYYYNQLKYEFDLEFEVRWCGLRL